MREENLKSIKRILSKFTETAEEDMVPESKLVADLGLTSFDVVTIVTRFEDEFDIEVPDRDIIRFVTINDILDYIEDKS